MKAWHFIVAVDVVAGLILFMAIATTVEVVNRDKARSDLGCITDTECQELHGGDGYGG